MSDTEGLTDDQLERIYSFGVLVKQAHVEATKAMKRFPQPNYVISKIAEEAGEVVKAAQSYSAPRWSAPFWMAGKRKRGGQSSRSLPLMVGALSLMQAAGKRITLNRIGFFQKLADTATPATCFGCGKLGERSGLRTSQCRSGNARLSIGPTCHRAAQIVRANGQPTRAVVQKCQSGAHQSTCRAGPAASRSKSKASASSGCRILLRRMPLLRADLKAIQTLIAFLDALAIKTLAGRGLHKRGKTSTAPAPGTITPGCGWWRLKG
jgi:hypothetical protein